VAATTPAQAQSEAAGDEAVLLDTAGFEDGYNRGENSDRGGLIGQAGWVAFPGGGGESLLVAGNRAIHGSASIRSLSSSPSAAAHPIELGDVDGPTELVVSAVIGNDAMDDRGSAVIGLTGALDSRTFLSVSRLGSTDSMRAYGPGDSGERQGATAEAVEGDGPFEFQLVVRAIPGDANDRGAVRFRPVGADEWQTVSPKGNVEPDDEGFVDLDADLPTEELHVFLIADGRQWRAAPRIDDVRVIRRPVTD
jgi:hypothetical protein